MTTKDFKSIAMSRCNNGLMMKNGTRNSLKNYDTSNNSYSSNGGSKNNTHNNYNANRRRSRTADETVKHGMMRTKVRNYDSKKHDDDNDYYICAETTTRQATTTPKSYYYNNNNNTHCYPYSSSSSPGSIASAGASVASVNSGCSLSPYSGSVSANSNTKASTSPFSSILMLLRRDLYCLPKRINHHHNPGRMKNPRRNTTTAISCLIVTAVTLLVLLQLLIAAIHLFSGHNRAALQTQQQQQQGQQCEGYWPESELCVDFGASNPESSIYTRFLFVPSEILWLSLRKPLLMKYYIQNAKYCPQWRINSDWGGFALVPYNSNNNNNNNNYGENDNKEFFTTKLNQIEEVARHWENQVEEMSPEEMYYCEKQDGVLAPPVVIQYEKRKTIESSRIERDVMEGSAEFHYYDRRKSRKNEIVSAAAAASAEKSQSNNNNNNNICWTDAFLDLYVDKFDVEPSEPFKEFVYNFDLDDFLDQLYKLRNCSYVLQ